MVFENPYTKPDWDKLVEDIHTNAMEHGWWDDERTDGEIFALVVSELSEALEEYRAGRDMVWYGDHGKPEGIAVELVDAVIRLLDFFGHLRAIGNDLYSVGKMDDAAVYRVDYANTTLPELVAFLTAMMGSGCAFEEDLKLRVKMTNNKYCFGMCFERVPHIICNWIAARDIDPYALISEKHEYNKSRPYRHGGKVL